MNVLIVAAHPDDECLGMGATIAKLNDEGHEVHILILGKGREDALDNRFDTIPLINIIQRIEKQIEEFQPDEIYTHWQHDLNVDHRLVFQAVLTACRPFASKVKAIYSFEVLSSTECSYEAFKPDTFINVEKFISKKVGMMWDKYEKEMREWPHPRSEAGIYALANYRGMQSGCEYAEAFKTVRVIR